MKGKQDLTMLHELIDIGNRYDLGIISLRQCRKEQKPLLEALYGKNRPKPNKNDQI